MSQPLPLSLFDFDLPPELIAQEPIKPRDASRLMVLPRQSGPVRHARFLDLPELLRAGDLLVVNRTQVIPARLFAKTPHGGKVELLFIEPAEGLLPTATRWRALGKPGSSLRAGKRVVLADGTELEIEGRDGMQAFVRSPVPLLSLLSRLGEVPLPPYIERQGARAEDKNDYQSIFAREPGAVAAPTASLHFTERVLAALAARGVARAEVTLHVGPGTFLPVRKEDADDVRNHVMHAEWYDVPVETREAVQRTRAAGGRVIAVGTTSLRALETYAKTGAATGASTLFLYPGIEVVSADGLLTNFHLPRSTLIMLVSALAGRDRVLAAYAEAVREKYRFFSYGDAMLVL